MLWFNGVKLPTPTSFDIDYDKVVKQKDTLSGRTVRMVLRRKLVLSCKWDLLDEDELQQLLAVESADSGTLKYWDSKDKKYKTTTVYAQDIGSTLENARELSQTTLKTISGISMTFKEF